MVALRPAVAADGAVGVAGQREGLLVVVGAEVVAVLARVVHLKLIGIISVANPGGPLATTFGPLWR